MNVVWPYFIKRKLYLLVVHCLCKGNPSKKYQFVSSDWIFFGFFILIIMKYGLLDFLKDFKLVLYIEILFTFFLFSDSFRLFVLSFYFCLIVIIVHVLFRISSFIFIWKKLKLKLISFTITFKLMFNDKK